MIVDCISDLHGHYPHLEGGDLLIVAGDLTAHDTQAEHLEFFQWFDSQDYAGRLWIAGNHDGYYQKNNAKTFIAPSGCAYLEDQMAEFEGLKIWGSPWTLRFEGMNPRCMAFTCETEEELLEKFALIPDDTDILVTHSPPWGLLDEVYSQDHCTSFSAGSKALINRIMDIKPIKLHVFGHIHEAYGVIDDKRPDHRIFVNASHVNECYEPVNKPIRVIL